MALYGAAAAVAAAADALAVAGERLAVDAALAGGELQQRQGCLEAQATALRAWASNVAEAGADLRASLRAKGLVPPAPAAALVPAAGAPMALVGSGWTPFGGVPIAIFALGCHLSSVPIAAEMRRDQVSRLPRVAKHATLACGLLYCAVGLAGYAEFGAATAGDIFLNFAEVCVCACVCVCVCVCV